MPPFHALDPFLSIPPWRGNALLVTVLLLATGCSYTFTYVNDKHISEADKAEILDAAEQAMQRRDYGEAEHLAAYVEENYAETPEAEEALYIAGEASFQDGSLWDAFEYYREILLRFRTSGYIDKIPPRLYRIGTSYLERKGGFWGSIFHPRGKGVKIMDYLVAHFRRIDLADDALLAVADYYYGDEKWEDAAMYYIRLVKEYPASEWVEKSVFRLGRSWFHSTKGPSYDRDPLVKAYRAFQVYLQRWPQGSFKEKAQASAIRARDMLAAKELEIADFYQHQGQDYGAWIHLSNLVLLFPETGPGKTAAARLKRRGWDTSINSKDRVVPRHILPFTE